MARYSQEKKDEVLKFVQEHNEKNGRGGQSAAATKYGLTPLTVKNWMDKAGIPTPGRGGKRRRGRRAVARKAPARKAAASKAATGGSIAARLQRMADIQADIEKLQAEYDSLKAQI